MEVDPLARQVEARGQRVGDEVDLVAASPEAYVQTAVRLAQDVERRRRLRAGLRESLRASPLLDHAGFTRKLEAEIERAWRAWCDTSR